MRIFKEGYEYFYLEFLENLNQIACEILRKLEEKYAQDSRKIRVL